MKSRAHNIHCTKGGWGMLPGNFEILHALKCVMVASEASFCAYSTYVYLQVVVFV